METLQPKFENLKTLAFLRLRRINAMCNALN